MEGPTHVYDSSHSQVGETHDDQSKPIDVRVRDNHPSHNMIIPI